jgi:LPXTG-site transpeptidase (sortase) family protein
MSTSEQGTGDRRRTSRRVILAAGVALLLAAGVLLYLAYAEDIRFALSQSDLTAAESTAPAPPAASTAPTTTIDLTGWAEQDEAYWRALKEGGLFGRIVAADADIDTLVVRGAETDDLAKGPGWIVQTDLPAAEGNCGISGHRVTHGHPFRRLDQLKVGATIDLYSPYRVYRYVVDRILRVTPDHVEVVAHTQEPRLTLTTCDPPGSDVKRLVVQARLVSVERVATRFGK